MAKLQLITNKHALANTRDFRETAQEINLLVNVRCSDGSTQASRAHLPLKFEDGSCVWREHNDADTDVMAFDVTTIINETKRNRIIDLPVGWLNTVACTKTKAPRSPPFPTCAGRGSRALCSAQFPWMCKSLGEIRMKSNGKQPGLLTRSFALLSPGRRPRLY